MFVVGHVQHSEVARAGYAMAMQNESQGFRQRFVMVGAPAER
jgi:hypothetical protein